MTLLRHALPRQRRRPRYSPLTASQRGALDSMFARTLNDALQQYA
jgi:hypothetical protein